MTFDLFTQLNDAEPHIPLVENYVLMNALWGPYAVVRNNSSLLFLQVNLCDHF